MWNKIKWIYTNVSFKFFYCFLHILSSPFKRIHMKDILMFTAQHGYTILTVIKEQMNYCQQWSEWILGKGVSVKETVESVVYPETTFWMRRSKYAWWHL